MSKKTKQAEASAETPAQEPIAEQGAEAAGPTAEEPTAEPTEPEEQKATPKGKADAQLVAALKQSYGVEEIFKVGDYWFTNRIYAEAESRATGQKLNTF